MDILLDNIPDCIYIKDCQSRFVKNNRKEAELLGIYDPEAAIGKTDADFFTPSFAHHAREEEEQIMKTMTAQTDHLEELRSKSGEVLWISATKAPIMLADGEVAGTVGISRDVSDRERFRLSLQESER